MYVLCRRACFRLEYDFEWLDSTYIESIYTGIQNDW